jgi:hypothetical protein
MTSNPHRVELQDGAVSTDWNDDFSSTEILTFEMIFFHDHESNQFTMAPAMPLKLKRDKPVNVERA